MATIRQRRPGVWEVRVFLGNDPVTGRKRQRSQVVHGGKRDAQAVATKLEHERIPGGPATRDVTLRDLLNAWFEHGQLTWSVATAQGYRSRIRIIVRSPLGATRLEDLTSRRLDQWYAGLIAAGQTPANIKNHHSLIRRACQQGLKWGWLATNPATLASPPRVPRPQVRAMDPGEVTAMLGAATGISSLAGLVLRLAAVTGARRGELAGLQWDDLVGDQLTIARSITAVPASRDEDHSVPSLTAGPTKTHAIRRLTLDAETRALVAERRVACEADATELGMPLGQWMLSPDPPNEQPPSPGWLSRLWRTCRQVTEIDSRWRLHDLRHWAATSLIASGEDVRLVAGRLGHARPATTLDVYAHYVDRGDERAATKLSELLGPSPDLRGGPTDPRQVGAQSTRAPSGVEQQPRRRGRTSRSKHRPN